MPEQREALAQYAEAHQWVILDWYVDEARSGTNADSRPALQEMIAAATRQPAPVDAVLVWDFSRFARNEPDAVIMRATLRKRNVTLVSCTQTVPDGPIGALVESIYDFLAAELSRSLKYSVLRGQHHLLSQGYWPGSRPPLGYRLAAVDYGPKRDGSRRTVNRIEVDPDAAALVRRAFALYADGGSLADAWHALDGALRYPATVHLLASRSYAGIFEYDGCEYGSIVPALVDLDTFERVQARLAARPHSRRVNSPFLLSGLLLCGECERPMSGWTVPKGGKLYRYYACSAKRAISWHACPSRVVRCEVVEAMLFAWLTATADLNVDTLQAALDAQAADAGARERAALEQALARSERGLQSLMVVARAGNVAPDKLEAQAVEQRQEIERLQSRLAALDCPDVAPAADKLERARAAVLTLAATLRADGPDALTRAQLTALIAAVKWTGDDVLVKLWI